MAVFDKTEFATSTGGGAVIREPGSAWLEGTPAMDHAINGKRTHM